MLADLTRRAAVGDELRGNGAMSWPDYLRLWEQFGYNGVQYVVPGGNIGELTAMQAQRNPIVWACVALRVHVFSEIKFLYQLWEAGRPGKKWGTSALSILDTPWPNANTQDLLGRMEVDVSLYGNSYWTKYGGQLVRLNPNRVTIATTDAEDATSGNPFAKRLIGYFLTDDKGHIAATFLPNEIAHYRPIPDPANEFRGASWLNALLPDVIADLDLTDYKHAFLQNAATPNLAVVFPPEVKQEAFDKFRNKMESAHTGPQSGFKTLYLGGGVDVKPVGSTFQDLAMQAVQSAGEVRIAAAAGVPAGLLGLAEALKGSTLNAGNYAATRRRFSDGTMRPLWRAACNALSVLAAVPNGSRLWYDEVDVAFLQEDRTDEATIHDTQAATILKLIQAGYTPESVVAAVTTGDYIALEHTGLISNQLQKPGPPLPPGGESQPDPQLDPVTGKPIDLTTDPGQDVEPPPGAQGA
jgi:phage portal protein BeeE